MSHSLCTMENSGIKSSLEKPLPPMKLDAEMMKAFANPALFERTAVQVNMKDLGFPSATEVFGDKAPKTAEKHTPTSDVLRDKSTQHTDHTSTSEVLRDRSSKTDSHTSTADVLRDRSAKAENHISTADVLRDKSSHSETQHEKHGGRDLHTKPDGSGEYTAKKGDTYWAVAKEMVEQRTGHKVLNNPEDMKAVMSAVKELAEFNGKQMVNGKIDLQVGESIKIPPEHKTSNHTSTSEVVREKAHKDEQRPVSTSDVLRDKQAASENHVSNADVVRDRSAANMKVERTPQAHSDEQTREAKTLNRALNGHHEPGILKSVDAFLGDIAPKPLPSAESLGWKDGPVTVKHIEHIPAPRQSASETLGWKVGETTIKHVVPQATVQNDGSINFSVQA